MTFCTPPFRLLALRRREALGLADLPVTFLPHPMMTRTPEEIGQIAEEALADVVRHLTTPVSAG